MLLTHKRCAAVEVCLGQTPAVAAAGRCQRSGCCRLTHCSCACRRSLPGSPVIIHTYTNIKLLRMCRHIPHIQILSYCACAGIYCLLHMQAAAAHVVLFAAVQFLFLYEAGTADCRRSLALVSHGIVCVIKIYLHTHTYMYT